MRRAPLKFKAIRAACVLILILAVQAGFGAEAQVKETVLPNGLKVLTKEVHAAPVVSFNVWYKVGSRNETFGKTGMSHLLEHMQFKGTKTLKKGEIDKLIQQNGGILNAATWKDWTYFWEVLSSDKLELAMRIESDRMVNSVIDPKEFQSERTVVRSELEGDSNDPDQLMYYELYALGFKAHPYHWPTIGWVHDVETITRDDLYKYYKTYYEPNNATVIIVGDFDTSRALAMANKYFGKIPKGPAPPKVTEVEPPQLGERDAVVRKAGAAYRVTIGWHTPAISSQDMYALDIIQQVLDAGASSRLYKALIDKQLATSESASSTTNRDPDMFNVDATARDGVKIEDVRAAILAEMDKLKTQQISNEEHQKALNQLEAQFIYANDSVSDQAEQLGYFQSIDTWRYIDSYLPNARKVTKADIQRVAQKYFDQKNMNVLTFIPDASAGPAAPSMGGGGPVRYCNYRPIGESGRGGDAASGRSELPTLNVQRSTPNVQGANPQPAIPNPKSLVTPTRVVLDNGMVVIVYPNRSNPTVAIQGSVAAGGMFDPQGKSGVAEITAALLQKGTTNRTADQIAETKDFVGMSIGASASTESAGFSGRSLSKNFDLMLNVLSDELRNPTFPADEFNKLKLRRLSGIKQEEDDPDSLAFRAFYGQVFPVGHPYHQLSVDEDIANTQAITRDDVAGFYKEHYGPQTAILVVVGDVDVQDAVTKVKQYFADWKASGPAIRPRIPDTPLQTGIVKKVIPMPDKTQVGVVVGYAGQLKRSDPDFYSATIMNYVLGGGGALGSKLGEKIRDEMGLVYTVYTGFDAGLGAGPWYAYLGTNPKNVDKAIKTMMDIIAQTKAKGETKDQVQRAIDFIAGSFPARRLVDNQSIAGTLQSAEFYGLGMDYIRKYQSLYRAVTLDQVNAAAKKYLHPDRYTMIIAGPYTEPGKQ
jgi:zinc protease